jgi:hypothetical protein
MKDYQSADSIIVKWTSGATQKLSDIKVNQAITIKEPFEFTAWEKFVLFLYTLSYV